MLLLAKASVSSFWSVYLRWAKISYIQIATIIFRLRTQGANNSQLRSFPSWTEFSDLKREAHNNILSQILQQLWLWQDVEAFM